MSLFVPLLEFNLIPNSELRVVHSLWGHNGLLGADPEYVKQIEGNLSELLAAST